MTGFVAVICGLKSEAAGVAEAIDQSKIRTGVSGANAARAERIASEFCNTGAQAVVSVGVSGGLDPALAPGDLVIGDRVVAADGSAWPSDMKLLKSLVTEPPGANARCGSLFGSDAIIASAEEKAALYERHGSLAVDMESQGCARAAAKAGVPFIAVRAIADPATRALPKAALNAVADDGSTRTFATLAAALRHPAQFPALIELGKDSSAALTTLRRDLGGLFRRLFLGLDL